MSEKRNEESVKELLRELIKAKVNVNAKDKDGYPVLICACEEGYTYLAKELIKAGANCWIVDSSATKCNLSYRSEYR